MKKTHSAIKIDGDEGFWKTLKETNGSKPLGLYVHIPFCKKKCPYCHFYVLPDLPHFQEAFHKALMKELALYREVLGDFPIKSLYFGGGTPSRYSKLADFLDELNPPPDIEITLEANPEDISLDKMELFQSLGINRVSIGIQSLVDSELTLLGRQHDTTQAIDAVWETYTAGITNITIDLMYELPFQTEESFNRTLTTVKKLPITHLSLYNLTFEQGTVFTKHRKKFTPHLPKEKTATKMLNNATLSLEAMGLHRYEISAFAKPGFEAMHNTGYWKGTPFLGLGPSAFSFLNGARYQNASHLKKYTSALEKTTFPIEFYEKLPDDDSLAERLAIHLRLFSGVNLKEFPKLPLQLEKRVQSLEGEGFLYFKGDRLLLTDKGRLFYDNVGAQLI